MSFRVWVSSLFWVGVMVLAGFVAVTSLAPGNTFLEKLGAAYRWLWTHTTNEEYTTIMRENPALLITAAVVILVLSGWKLPRRYWARAVLLYLTFGIGFVVGHVLW